MNTRKNRASRAVSAVSAVLVAATLVASAPAHATYPVIDVAAIKQLVMQVNYWKQQIAAMKSELNQLQQTHAALTGGRGMELLLPTNNAQRNYLPADWSEMLKVLDGTSAQYGALSGAVNAAMQARAVLDDARLGSLYDPERERFAALQGLVSAIGAAPDAKAIADLQGRIAAEEAMLGNEQAKLATLYQAAQAEQWAQAAALREAAIAGHGQFDQRLHPVLPN
jgi:type IV secretion system protein VirB5